MNIHEGLSFKNFNTLSICPPLSQPKAESERKRSSVVFVDDTLNMMHDAASLVLQPHIFFTVQMHHHINLILQHIKIE